jgi:hypothetical protein
MRQYFHYVVIRGLSFFFFFSFFFTRVLDVRARITEDFRGRGTARSLARV